MILSLDLAVAVLVEVPQVVPTALHRVLGGGSSSSGPRDSRGLVRSAAVRWPGYSHRDARDEVSGDRPPPYSSYRTRRDRDGPPQAHFSRDLSRYSGALSDFQSRNPGPGEGVRLRSVAERESLRARRENALRPWAEFLQSGSREPPRRPPPRGLNASSRTVPVGIQESLRRGGVIPHSRRTPLSLGMDGLSLHSVEGSRSSSPSSHRYPRSRPHSAVSSLSSRGSRRPYLSDDSDSDVSDLKRRSLFQRNDPLSTFTSVQHGPDNSTENESGQFQTYLEAYGYGQSNVSDALFPILDEILAGTNSSLVYDAAWSIWTELTGVPEIVVGPFTYGMHCLDWIEDRYLNKTNPGANGDGVTFSNSTDPALLEFRAVSSVLLELYAYAWEAGVKAANTTGLLDDMSTLASYMGYPDDESIAPIGFNDVKPMSYDDSYFTIYNQTMNQTSSIPGLD